MFDKDYDDPNYNPGGYDDNPQPQGGFKMPDLSGYATGAAGMAGSAGAAGAQATKDAAKKWIPIAIIGVIGLAVILFALFWIMSNQAVEFNVKELDGGMLNAKITIESGSNKVADNKTVRNGLYTMNLAPGDYTYTITATDHVSETGSFTVPSDELKEPLEVELAKKANIVMEYTLDEEKIFETHTVKGTLKLKNTGTSDLVEEQLIVETSGSDKNGKSSTAVLDINFTPSLFSVSEGGETSVIFTLSIRKDITSSADSSVTVKVKGTDQKKTITIRTMPSIKIEDLDVGSIAKSGLEKLSLTSGKEEDTTIVVENKDEDIELNDLKIEIVANSGSEDKLSWIRIDQAPNDNLTTRVIDSILPEGETPVKLYFRPPLDAEVGDKFSGNIVFSSIGLTAERIVPLDLEVKTSSDIKLTLSSGSISITCSDDTGCPKKPVQFTLKNESTTEDIKDIKITLDEMNTDTTMGTCLTWMSLQTTSVALLEKGKETTIYADIQPISPETVRCYLRFDFENPITKVADYVISNPAIVITAK
ncbi:MAG: hypothetical protein AABW59_03215 [archaeon]